MLDTELALNNQELSKKWANRVVAVHKTDENEPSNTVTALL
ncbi:MAG: hypothetical protein WGN25_10515 [Candidatus Electrothrix sp. GW3-4]